MFFILLFFPFLLFCNVIVTQNDPSSLVEGVSVITGHFYTCEEDYVVQGSEPIRWQRSQISGVQTNSDFIHLFASYIPATNIFSVPEKNGTAFWYQPHPKITQRYNILLGSSGITNTASGKVSAQTNLQNQHLSLDPNGKKFSLHCANGTKKYYEELKNQIPSDLGLGQKGFITYNYKLVHEELPNGNKINYCWNNENQLETIYTTNPRNTKIYATLRFPRISPDQFTPKLKLTGSDGRSLIYESTPIGNKTYGLRDIVCPDFPKLHLDYEIREKKIKVTPYKKKTVRTPLLNRLSLPRGRTLHIEYDNTDEHRVKRLCSPTGKDASLQPTHSFFYDPTKRSSYVLDAYGNKTAYFWDGQFHLTRIDHFDGDRLGFSEIFSWDNIFLRTKSLVSAEGKIFFSRCYEYDSQEAGNPTAETFQFETGTHTRKISYSKDGRNLPVKQEEGKLVILSTYHPNAHLLLSQSVCEKDQIKIETTYTYNDDLILICERTENAIKRITPIEVGLYIGLPKIIEEGFWNGVKEVLLKKTILNYGIGAQITCKEIYDAANVFRYSLEIEYDEQGHILRQTNPIGQEALFKYDELGNTIFFQDFGSQVVIHNRYDFSNRLIERKEIGADGASRIHRYSYDLKHNLESEIDFRGNEIKYKYNAFGRRTETHLPQISNHPSIVLRDYDPAGNEILTQDAEGNITHTTCNAYGNPLLIIHPDGTREENVYNSDGTLKIHTDSNGVLTEYKYDFLKRIVSKKTEEAEEKFEYHGSQLSAKWDAEGIKTQFFYDGSGRKIAEECSGERIEFTYDTLGRLHTVRKDGEVHYKEYDLLDQVIEERVESDEGKLLTQIRYEYDPAGNKVAIVRHNSREEFAYDPWKRLVRKKDALGNIETTDYDDWHQNARGQNVLKKTHTDALGLQTITIYDAQNHIASVEKKKDGKTLSLQENHRDCCGRIVSQIETIASKQSHTQWEYDQRGRVKTLIEEKGKITTYLYSPKGDLLKKIKPDGVVLSYIYNSLNQLTQVSSSDGTVFHEMQYDRTGHLIRNDKIERNYDGKGRLLWEIFPQGYKIENVFDQKGRRIGFSLPDSLIEYGYEGSRLAYVIRKTLAGDPLYRHDYRLFDLSGNLLEEQGIRGAIVYDVDALSRRVAITAPQFTQKILEFDPIGNILNMRIQNEELAFSYDPLYQLLSEPGYTYLFDALHNRLQKNGEFYDVNAANQIVSHFEYDPNGNPIAWDNLQCSYDALDRLVSIKTPTVYQTFTYDFLNRCITKTCNGDMFYFLYDGQNEIGALDDCLRPLELRILGEIPHAEIGAAVAIELNEEIYAPIHDLQGNIAVMIPLHDEETSFYRYSAFGEEQLSGPAVSPWRFSSKRSDPDTKLVYYGRRFYSPAFGRWLTPDPAGFDDGKNLYAFVHNAPLTHFDEYGLLTLCVPSLHYEQNPGELTRNTLSKTFHETYDWLKPLYNDRMLNAFSIQGNGRSLSERFPGGHHLIDRIFGTQLADSYLNTHAIPSSFKMQQCVMPFPGTSFGSITSRVSETSKNFFTTPAFQPKARLSSPLTRNNTSQIRMLTKNKASAFAQDVLFPDPLKNTRYSPAVLNQMRLHKSTAFPDHHAFPRIVDNYARYGEKRFVAGGDNITRLWIELPGGYQGKQGKFHWIIEPNGEINHRFFQKE